MSLISVFTRTSLATKVLAGVSLVAALTGGAVLALPAQATPPAPAAATLEVPAPATTTTPTPAKTALETHAAAAEQAAQAAPGASVPIDHLGSVTPSAAPVVSTLPAGTSLPTDARITYRTVTRDYKLSDDPMPGIFRMAAGARIDNACGTDFAAKAVAQLTPISGAPVFVQSLSAAYHNLPENQYPKAPESSTAYVARTDGNAFTPGDDFRVRLTVTCAKTTGSAKFWHTSFATPADAGGSSYTRNMDSSKKFVVEWANACAGGTSVGAGWLIQAGQAEDPLNAGGQQRGPFFVTDLKGGGSGFEDTAQIAVANLRGKDMDMTPDSTTGVGRDDVAVMSGYCYAG